MFTFSQSKTAIFLQYLLVLQILCLRNKFIFRCQITSVCIHNTQSMHFPYITYGMMLYINDSIPTKHLHWEKCMHMRASGASELRKFSNFNILKLLLPSIFCWYFRYFVSETYINFRCHITSAYIIQWMQFPFITYGIWCYENDRTDRQNTNIEKMNVYASEWSERA